MKVNVELENYLKRKKWAIKENATQFIVKTCPLCGDNKYHFYINKSTGQYICWKCDESGNFYTLKKALGDLGKIEKIAATPTNPTIPKEKYKKLVKYVRKWNKNLLLNRKALSLLKRKWNFDKKAVKRFKLGLQKKYNLNWLVIPQFEDGRLANVKYRTLSLKIKKFRREKDMNSILFNIDRLDPELDYVFLFEGETDCITADTYLGVKNALGVTVGARGFKEEWIQALEGFENIYIVYDSDVAGRKGAEKISKRLGKHRCRNIEISSGDTDSIDLNEWWKEGHNKEDFEKLIEKAETFETKDVYQISTILTSVESDLYFSGQLDSQGYTTQWDNVNKVLGPMVAGDLIVLSGIAKVGKTTWALNLLLNHALNGVPTMLYCLEMRPERIVTKIISYFRGIDRSSIASEDVVYVKARFGKKPFYIAHSYKFTADEVFETIKEAVNRYGIELLVFDHLHFLIRDIQNVASQVATTVRDFKLLAENLKIPIILICQPRKMTVGNKMKRMTTDDLRDSSAIGQDADTVIILHRNRIEGVRKKEDGNQMLFDPETEVIVDATRYNPGGIARLWYNGEISRYFLNAVEERRFLTHEIAREI